MPPLLSGMIATFERAAGIGAGAHGGARATPSRRTARPPSTRRAPARRSCACWASSRSREPEDAPSNLAVIGRYVFTPEIFDAIEQVKPGVGGEIQLTDAIALLLDRRRCIGYRFSAGRYDTGNKLDWLVATVELASTRDDLGPDFRSLPASSSWPASIVMSR